MHSFAEIGSGLGNKRAMTKYFYEHQYELLLHIFTTTHISLPHEKIL